MKIAIISDIHANLEALKATLEDIKKRNVDKIFCIGDIIAKGYHTHECIELIKNNCEVILQGNCDRHFTEDVHDFKIKTDKEIRRWNEIGKTITESEKDFLRKLPFSYEFYLSGSLIRLFHANPERDNITIINEDSIEDKYKMFLPSEKTMSQEVADIVIYGHIHHQYMDKIYNKTLINTGSVGNSFCLIRNDEKDSDINEVRQANYCLLEGDYGSKEYDNPLSIQLIRVPYNVEKELAGDTYYEKEEFAYEIKNATYRNMEKIKKNFERLGIDSDKF